MLAFFDFKDENLAASTVLFFLGELEGSETKSNKYPLLSRDNEYSFAKRKV